VHPPVAQALPDHWILDDLISSAQGMDYQEIMCLDYDLDKEDKYPWAHFCKIVTPLSYIYYVIRVQTIYPNIVPSITYAMLVTSIHICPWFLKVIRNIIVFDNKRFP
jgi:hypothetical protein